MSTFFVFSFCFLTILFRANALPTDQQQLNRRQSQSCPNPAVRVSWRNLSSDEKRSYQESVMCLLEAPSKMNFPGAQSRYDDLIYVHQVQSDYPNGNDVWHVTGQFLAAHRLYTYIFELLLRQECGYQGRFPYWDEKADAGNFHNSEYLRDFGGVGDSQGRVTHGMFANLQVNMGPGFSNVRRTLRRQINETASQTAGSQFYDYIMSQNSFSDFMSAILQYNHLAGHNGVGGEMADVQTAPVDPIFFGHHGYIDCIWSNWQKMAPERRIYDLRNAGFERQSGERTETNLMTVLSFMGLADDLPLYAALDTEGGFLCYRCEIS